MRLILGALAVQEASSLPLTSVVNCYIDGTMAETILLPVEDDHAENTATEKKPSRGITILSSSIEDQGVTSFE